MANCCFDCLEIIADDVLLTKILTDVKSEKSEFDFAKIRPLPAKLHQAYEGKKLLNQDEINEAYEWLYKNWGVTKNAYDIYVQDNSVSFVTAWAPCSPIIAALAEKYPEARFRYGYTENTFCGIEEYRNGELVYEMTGDLEENPEWYSDDEDSDEYLLEDELYPIRTGKENTEFCQFLKEKETVNPDGERVVKGDFYYRAYGNGKLIAKVDGKAMYKGREPEFWYSCAY